VKIKQVYVPYWEWECFQFGFYSKVKNESQALEKAIIFTGDYQLYGSAMLEVVDVWVNTMKNHLTNPSINKRAFVGHCAVCYKTGIPSYITRKAWKHLTDKQRILADNEAEKAIRIWNKKYLTTLQLGKKDVIKKGYQMKLQLN
jgi:hypothetical protein